MGGRPATKCCGPSIDEDLILTTLPRFVADYEQPFMAVLCAVPCHTVIKNMPNMIFKSDQVSEGYDTESSQSTAQSHYLLLFIFGSGKQWLIKTCNHLLFAHIVIISVKMMSNCFNNFEVCAVERPVHYCVPLCVCFISRYAFTDYSVYFQYCHAFWWDL